MDVPTPYRRLALAVIEAAVRDAWAGCADAQRFLTGPSPLLALWAGWLCIKPETVCAMVTNGRMWAQRIERAKAVLRQSPASRYPQIGHRGEASRVRISAPHPGHVHDLGGSQSHQVGAAGPWIIATPGSPLTTSPLDSGGGRVPADHPRHLHPR